MEVWGCLGDFDMGVSSGSPGIFSVVVAVNASQSQS